jgi:3-methyl-2-oxobutanoate hydroxymethyltransferase
MNAAERLRFLRRLKVRRRRITVLTAYDAPTAALLEKAGVDLILVGDSVGPVLLGHPSTTDVTMDEIIHHARAVRRGAPQTPVIGDLPLAGRTGGIGRALAAARRFVSEGGCDAVKLEWDDDAPRLTALLVRRGIPVMGHVGLTPQTAEATGGLRARGRTAEEACAIRHAAKAFESAGAFSVVLECIPAELGASITKALAIPTIGIGAGPSCDGQVLVFQDLVGANPGFEPRFLKRYARTRDAERRAVAAFLRDVRGARFPARRHGYAMKKGEWERYRLLLKLRGEAHP